MSRMIDLAERWRVLETLPPNWDGYRANPPALDVLQRAKELAKKLADRQPWPMPHSDGSVALYLDGKGDDCSIEVQLDGGYSVYLECLSLDEALAALRARATQGEKQ